jgi:1-acyl-sn-glycerol-3-phosphate acyltransferase
MLQFKAGLGMIVAGTPVPVVPCSILGADAALPPGSRLPRPRKLRLKIGPPLNFESAANARPGWEQVAREAEEAVRRLGDRPDG